MRLPKNIPIYGNTSYRGDCKLERLEQIDCYHWLKYHHPTYGRLFIHQRNEGKKGYRQISHEKKDGSMNPGVSDIVIPGNPSFVAELKRKDHTKSSLPADELDYLEVAQSTGCFVCVVLGFDGFKEAFEQWLNTQDSDHA